MYYLFTQSSWVVALSLVNNNNVTIQHFPSRPQATATTQATKRRLGSNAPCFPTRPRPLTVSQSDQSSSYFSCFIHQKAAKDRIFRPIWWEFPVVLGFLLSFLFFFCLLWEGIGLDAGASDWVICELCNVGSARSIRQALWVAPLFWSFLCAACVGLGCFVLGNCGKFRFFFVGRGCLDLFGEL